MTVCIGGSDDPIQVAPRSHRGPAKTRWLKPRVVPIAFTVWTDDRMLRHARYVDLRPEVARKSGNRID